MRLLLEAKAACRANFRRGLRITSAARCTAQCYMRIANHWAEIGQKRILPALSIDGADKFSRH